MESSHSTLSKIIGLTWQQLSNEERQKWHAKAKVAQEEHKRKYPGYSFKPVHQRLKGAGLARRKLREVGLKDQKRCEKIAELLAEGKKGRELEDAVREFDKHHVPQVVTRFEEPITASSFDCSSRGSSPFSTYSRRSTTPSSQGRTSRSGIPTPPPVEQPEQITQLLSFNSNALFPTHSFVSPSVEYIDSCTDKAQKDIDNFGFSVQLPSPAINTVVAPLMGSDVVEGYGDVPHCDPNPPLSLRFAHIDEWAPAPCSPVSPQHSTDNLPTTPVDSQTAFADPHLHHDALYSDRHAYPAFAPDAAVPQGRYHHASSDDECPRPFPSYVPNFTGYTEYHAYSAPLPTVQQTCHGASLKRAEGVAACYGGAAGHGHVRPNPMARDDLDFSFFMESFDPYPL